MKNTLITLVNVYRFIKGSKKFTRELLSCDKDLSRSENDKKALAIGRWELYKQVYLHKVGRVGLFENGNAERLFFKCMELVRSEGGSMEISGDDMLKLYDQMQKCCEICYEKNITLDKFLADM